MYAGPVRVFVPSACVYNAYIYISVMYSHYMYPIYISNVLALHVPYITDIYILRSINTYIYIYQ